uniref:Ig-like domain-containing protein n=1 Tax=Takifugu rubripes TaxID=31033 RepID=A0A674MGH2_TAKRU
IGFLATQFNPPTSVLLHSGEARVNTEAPAGPLYRVVGSLLSITCNTSGFSNNHTNKEFEFRIKMPAKPVEINIISTHDNLFQLRHVFAACEEPGGQSDTRDAKLVIDDSLTVSSPGPTSLSYDEGGALTLTCRASSNTVQHTHLSLTWYLQKSGEDNPRPIMSLDRDLTLIAGPGFEGRYQDGLIRLDKVGEGTYRLKFAKLKLSDQGEIYCRAQEWIQDPDRSWYSITQKEAEKLTLSVRAREVLPATSSLVVRMSAQPKVLQQGQDLSLSCSLDTQNLEEKFFTVAWFRGSVELARIGPSGILSVSAELSARAERGELQVARRGVRDYSLVLQPVGTEDQGEYTCRAWPQLRGQDGGFEQETPQDSDPEYIKISAPEGGFSLDMQNSLTVKEGDRLSLTCRVNGGQGQLSVTWQHKATSPPAAAFTNVISLNQDGVVEKGPAFAGRHVRAARPATDTFTLELDRVAPADAGVYQCVVSEWKSSSKTNSQFISSNVTVAPTGERRLRLRRTNRSRIIHEASCIFDVSRVDFPLDTIVTVYADGSISWSGVQRRYQLKVESKRNEVLHYLLINGASHAEAGSYRCSVSVFQDGVYRRLLQSNQLAINTVSHELSLSPPTVSSLELTSALSVPGSINTDIALKCSVLTKSSPSSRYAVTWQLQKEDGNTTILSSDQNALVMFGSQLEPSFRQRLGIMRSEGPTFWLFIRHAHISDRGSYTCKVVEWFQASQNVWDPLTIASRTILLTLTEPENDLHVYPKQQSLVNVSTSQDFTVLCHITQQSSADSEFQVTWFWQEKSAENQRRPIFTAYRNSTLQAFEKSDQLRFSRPLHNNYSLTVSKAAPGMYFCEVEEWLPSLSHGWRKIATQRSGHWTVDIGPTVDSPGKRIFECSDVTLTWIIITLVIFICLLSVVYVLILKMRRTGKKPEKDFWTEQVSLNTKPCMED